METFVTVGLEVGNRAEKAAISASMKASRTALRGPLWAHPGSCTGDIIWPSVAEIG